MQFENPGIRYRRVPSKHVLNKEWEGDPSRTLKITANIVHCTQMAVF